MCVCECVVKSKIRCLYVRKDCIRSQYQLEKLSKTVHIVEIAQWKWICQLIAGQTKHRKKKYINYLIRLNVKCEQIVHVPFVSLCYVWNINWYCLCFFRWGDSAFFSMCACRICVVSIEFISISRIDNQHMFYLVSANGFWSHFIHSSLSLCVSLIWECKIISWVENFKSQKQ